MKDTGKSQTTLVRKFTLNLETPKVKVPNYNVLNCGTIKRKLPNKTPPNTKVPATLYG